jgi:cytochrome bd ubiquinol oxidase subunit I
MTKFWGKLFVINFAMGVVTGLVMEFQFGMNWSEYSRSSATSLAPHWPSKRSWPFSSSPPSWASGSLAGTGCPRGAPGAIWLVAIGSNLSALWILIANSFMQEPVGYVLRNGRAEMTDFGALLTNPHVWVQFPHVFFAGMTTAGFFVLGISAYHLYRGQADRAREGTESFAARSAWHWSGPSSARSMVGWSATARPSTWSMPSR